MFLIQTAVRHFKDKHCVHNFASFSKAFLFKLSSGSETSHTFLWCAEKYQSSDSFQFVTEKKFVQCRNWCRKSSGCIFFLFNFFFLLWTKLQIVYSHFLHTVTCRTQPLSMDNCWLTDETTFLCDCVHSFTTLQDQM